MRGSNQVKTVIELRSRVHVIPTSPIWLSLSCFPSQTHPDVTMKSMWLDENSPTRAVFDKLKKCFLTLSQGISQGWVTQDLVILAVFSLLKHLCRGLWCHLSPPSHIFTFKFTIHLLEMRRPLTHIPQIHKYTVIDLTSSLSAFTRLLPLHWSIIWLFEPTECMPTGKKT